MPLKAAMWVHGTAMEVEYPQNLIDNGIHREGVGTHFYGIAGITNWFQFPFPTPVVLDGARPSLVTVFLFYKVDGHIKRVHIWDGPFCLRKFDNLHLSGNHLNGIDKHNTWRLTPPLTINFGLKLAVQVEYASLFDPPALPPERPPHPGRLRSPQRAPGRGGAARAAGGDRAAGAARRACDRRQATSYADGDR